MPLEVSHTNSSVSLGIPDQPLSAKSLQISLPNKRLTDWSPLHHRDSHSLILRTVQAWKDNSITDQYLIYAKVDSQTFKWEMVPYQKCKSFVTRAIQQIKILWRIVFGGIKISEKNKKEILEKYREIFQKPITKKHSAEESKSNDAFCKEETIKRQLVLSGNKVNVLFNYAPIGFGGEKLHFLVVPKRHCENISNLTQDEFCESMDLTQKIVEHLQKTRQIKAVYIFGKEGKDAGQTVSHAHIQLTATTKTAQDIMGKLTVFKNILFGSKPMKAKDLQERVRTLSHEFTNLRLTPANT
ncbi:MAG: hypothetical protein BGO14_06290 [Chlamydiales bacterium 38-26]|nr:HIT family protein [Chlamydiales bacterium]OJV08497.1 MAG: hypothetical protein BGO14_06290 [Chlamydiales bacterium 38-26]